MAAVASGVRGAVSVSRSIAAVGAAYLIGTLPSADIVTRLETAGFECPDLSIGFYPGAGRVEIRISAPDVHIAALDVAERTLRELLQDYLAD